MAALRPRARPAAASAAASTSNDDRAALKRRLLALTAATRRGKDASAARRREVAAAVAALEAVNPTPEPALSPALRRDWALLWTGPADPDDAAWEKRSGGLEGPVLAALAPLGKLLGLRGGSVNQNIAADGASVHNVASFTALGARGALDVRGTVAVASASRVDVVFDRCEVSLGNARVAFPLTAVSPAGWVETTYLDDTLRIGRGDKGSLFVVAAAD